MNAKRIADIVCGAVVLAMTAAAIWALSRMPGDHPIAIHFGPSGQPNGWAPADRGLFILPVVGALLWVVRRLAPILTPRGANLERSPAAYGTIWIAVTLFLGLGQAQIVAGAVGVRIDITGAVPALLGLLFIVIGNVVPKLRWNYVVGIRTPWTLADERVWDKTHRFGGWVMVLGGVVMAIGGLIPPYTAKPGLVAGVTGLIAVLTVGKSYLLWRDQQRHGPANPVA